MASTSKEVSPNLKRKSSTDTSDDSPKKKKSQWNQRYRQEYTNAFPCIIKSSKGENFVFCTVCKCDISVAHGGFDDVKRHINRDKHKTSANAVNTMKPMASYFSKGTDLSVIRSECLYISHLLEKNIPLNTTERIGNLFKNMFPDSKIASNFSCGRTKTHAIINEMAFDTVHEMSSLMKSSAYSISTDGSNDSDSKLYPLVARLFNPSSGCIEVTLISLPNLIGDSTGKNIADLISQELNKLDIDLSKCLSFASDNANVMIGKKKGVLAYLIDKQPEIIPVGCPCHLIHLAAKKGTSELPLKIDDLLIDIYYYFEMSAKRKQELQTFQLLCFGETRKILKHVATRWLSLESAVNRLLEQWKPLREYFEKIVSEKKSSAKRTENTDVSSKSVGASKDSTKSSTSVKKTSDQSRSSVIKYSKAGQVQPALFSDTLNVGKSCSSNNDQDKCKEKRKVNSKPLLSIADKSKKSADDKSAGKVKRQTVLSTEKCREERIFDKLESMSCMAYVSFLSSVLPVFNSTNTNLQLEAPCIHIMRKELENLVKHILMRFVKPSVITQAESVHDINFRDASIQKSNDNIMIGEFTEKVVENLDKDEQNTFFRKVRAFYEEACDYMLKKFPLKEEVFIHAQVADIAERENVSFKSIKYFVSKFSFLLQCEGGSVSLDTVQNQFLSYQIDILPTSVLDEVRVDKQWHELSLLKDKAGSLKYNHLARIMLAILVIPHSNTDCERVFSLVRKTRTEYRANMSNATLESVVIEKVKRMAMGQQTKKNFSDAFLKKAKKATYVANQMQQK